MKAGFPEVLFNMFPGMGGLSFITRRASRSIADQMSRTGRLYTAQELHDLGLVDQVVDTGTGASAVSELIRQRATHRSAHDALNRVDRLLLDRFHYKSCTTLQRSGSTVHWTLMTAPLHGMRRLHQRQLQIFGEKPALVSVTSTKGQVLAA